MRTSVVIAIASLIVDLAQTATYPAIDTNLTPSYATKPNISYVDISLSTYDRIVLNYDGAPFFYNGVQIRADNPAILWSLTDDEIGTVYKAASSAGFTVANRGAQASKNFASTAIHKIGYSSTNTTAQSLTYLKFDFSDYSIDQIDAAKVRFYVNANATGNAPFTANLYGIRNKTWTADTLTWNDAPNHDGVDISGVNGSSYWHASSSPSWDPILQASYYDLDASDYIIKYCSDKIASFIF
ncbi:hypothetical protein BKA61DRAFT_682816 [Leptodontidium sp. MPI-SDFR-AT-0119]|nr:hypothetical protein BKA61DRAFT_682816 [Leptodontidium sp. MPI-SDFR-AT-0119]